MSRRPHVERPRGPITPEEPEGAVPTVFHVTHHKSGSQWVYAILKKLQPSRIVTPQVHNAQYLEAPIRPGCIYPTIYLDRERFESIVTPGESRRFVVIRDLRDTLVSLYFSFRYSHPILVPANARMRAKLNAMDKPEGLLWLLREGLGSHARLQRSWLGPGEVLLRFEDLVANPLASFRRILDHCEIQLSDEALARALDESSFEALSRRKPGQEDIHSHWRKGVAGDWKNHFTPELTREFKERFPGLLVETGYEESDDW